MEKLRLFSDFIDFYDHWFDGHDSCHVLRRHTKDGLDKYCQLNLLERNGLKVPAYGRVSDILNPRNRPGSPEKNNNKVSKKCEKLVVYTDERVHCGDGKLLLSLDEALEDYPFCNATEYIPDCPSLSWRYLQVGMHGFWLEYKSDEDWRSNCGEGSVKLIGHEKGWHNHPEVKGAVIFKLPLYAIDFVIGKELYAVDFNVAPGMRGTGIEKILSPKEIVETIKDAYFQGEYISNLSRYYTG